jgi:hypothetical protein
MSYDIIIGTDWIEKHDPHISFKNCEVVVGGQSVTMENIREDLIRKCTLIQARDVEALLKEDKIVEMVVWSLTKTEGKGEQTLDEQINELIKEFADVFATDLRTPPDRGTHNFRIKTVAGAKPQVRQHGRLSKREMEEMRKKIKELLAVGHIELSASP